MNKIVKISMDDVGVNSISITHPYYLEALSNIERIHRSLLDVIKDEFAEESDSEEVFSNNS